MESLTELRDVLGMTPDLPTALLPYVSLDADRPPDPAAAPDVVRAALSDIGMRAKFAGTSDVFRIEAEAVARSGARAIRLLTVRIGPSPSGKLCLTCQDVVGGIRGGCDGGEENDGDNQTLHHRRFRRPELALSGTAQPSWRTALP